MERISVNRAEISALWVTHTIFALLNSFCLQFFNFSLIGKSGKILMNQDSDRVSEYSVWSTNNTNDYTPMLTIPPVIKGFNDASNVNRVSCCFFLEVALLKGAHYFDKQSIT